MSKYLTITIKDSEFRFGQVATKHHSTGLIVEISLATLTVEINFEHLTADENQSGDIQLKLSIAN